MTRRVAEPLRADYEEYAGRTGQAVPSIPTTMTAASRDQPRDCDQAEVGVAAGRCRSLTCRTAGSRVQSPVELHDDAPGRAASGSSAGIGST